MNPCGEGANESPSERVCYVGTRLVALGELEEIVVSWAKKSYLGCRAIWNGLPLVMI